MFSSVEYPIRMESGKVSHSRIFERNHHRQSAYRLLYT
ncbi:hypothetical protein KNP414_04823 [Paenibacillus mucilaginosus KNP414]|uniref:Uncharacterized protein n=1 Tax=Paenibacillus mucilaginosus (strain KNP414) TaxID=1036673 RepID=F8FI07_PAEMK|nr:hypothetical protein KNP414_04823 [Paenibacillus mucilaginosus KNP414]